MLYRATLVTLFFSAFLACASLPVSCEPTTCIGPGETFENGKLMFCQRNTKAPGYMLGCSYGYINDKNELCYHVLVQEESCFKEFKYVGTTCISEEGTDASWHQIDYTKDDTYTPDDFYWWTPRQG